MLSFTFPGPEPVISLHNHSNWSDGSASLEEMCLAGKAAGLRIFGMSDHWVLPNIDGLDSVEWSMPLEKVGEYVSELQRLRAKYSDETFSIAIGLEVDFFFENFNEMRSILSICPLDYIIGSVHYSESFPIDHDSSDWEGKTQKEIDRIYEVFWAKMLGAAETGYFTILGHLDLPKKFGYKPSFDQLPYAVKVLEAAKKTNTAIEINTAGWEKPCKEQYPCLDIIKEARRLEVPIVISSDAHKPANVTLHFDRAAKL